MLLLPNTTDKIQLVTSAAATIDVHASYMDHTLSSDNVEGNRQNTAITTATTTDIVASPGAGVTRNVKTLHIRNKHASTSCDVTVVYDANSTDYELHKTTLRAGETLEYIEGIGFFTIVAQTNPAGRQARLSADQSNSTTTPTEVTGLSLTTGLGVFDFSYKILYQAAAATTGVRFSVNHTGTVTAFVYNILFVGLVAAAADANADQDSTLATGVVYNAFSARAKGTAGVGTTITVDTANADMLTVIEGLAIVTADGDLELWHGSEVAAASTVKAGTSLVLTRTGD